MKRATNYEQQKMDNLYKITKQEKIKHEKSLTFVPKVNTDYSFKQSHDPKFNDRMEKDLRRRIKSQMNAEQILEQKNKAS